MNVNINAYRQTHRFRSTHAQAVIKPVEQAVFSEVAALGDSDH